MTPEQRAALMSSACMDWETPLDLVHELHTFEPITLDPCTAPDNPTGARMWISPPADGLGQKWNEITAGVGHVYVNPPYGRALEMWTSKAASEARNQEHLTALTPARTDTAWYRGIVKTADAVVYLDGRLMFRVRCEKCTLGAGSILAPPPAVYASRWFKRGDQTVYYCADCALTAHAANGGNLETKPIAKAAFPSMLAYWGVAVERWGARFGHWGDLRILRNRPPPADTRQKSLFT